MTLLTSRRAAPPEAEARVLKRRGGVTLVELLVVIGIVILLATAVSLWLPQFQKGRELEGTVYEIRNLLARARQEALSQEATVQVRFDTAGRLCALEQVGASTVQVATFQWPKSVVVSAPAQVVFTSEGKVQSGSSATIEVKEKGSPRAARVITVGAHSGSATI